VYKYLDVGTNKEGVLLRDGVRVIDGIAQYLTDIMDPNEAYNAADFARDADLKISEIIKKGKRPVIVGGTGLYIKTLLYGLDEMPKADMALRRELKMKSQCELYSELLKLDKKAAEKNKKNPQRLLRALEINILSGKTLQQHFKPKIPRYKFKHFSMLVKNKTLYEKINERCEYMLENGMIAETQKILNMGFNKDCVALSGIGYKHVVQYLDGEISKKNMLEEFSKDTRHYAKRQNVWFKNQPDIEFI
jgi:tRNA dimethylallyltransferase